MASTQATEAWNRLGRVVVGFTWSGEGIEKLRPYTNPDHVACNHSCLLVDHDSSSPSPVPLPRSFLWSRFRVIAPDLFLDYLIADKVWVPRMAPSFRQSLSDALHSLQNPHFRRRSPLTVPLHKDNNPAQQTFDLDLCNRLSRLDREDQGYLSLPWLQDAMSVVLFAYSSVLGVLPKTSFKEKEKWLLEANLDDSLKILDACNGLKEVVNDLQHYVMLVRYAARTGADVRDASDEACKSKLVRVNDALLKLVDFMHARDEEKSRLKDGRSKLETCSSLLRRMGEQMTDSSSGGTLFNEIYASKVLAIFICGVLATALSVKPKRPLALLHLADHPDWSALLQTLQQNVKKATDGGIKDGKIVLLEELDQVRLCTHELHVLLNKILEQESLPPDADRLNLSRRCEELSKHAGDLQQGLLVLQQQIDDLFRMIIATRVDFLDTLCHV